MSKFDQAIAAYTKHLEEMGEEVDAKLLHRVVRSIGPAIYNRDAQTVAFTQPAEVDRVRRNFLVKRLGLEDSDALNDMIQSIGDTYKATPRYRGVIYYLLVKKANKAALFL
ncbi:MAG: DUF2853 family protein [Gammaproteobacteria bacterium]|nr:DUF2853 family protein [Gammaproteobacteria bacterium]